MKTALSLSALALLVNSVSAHTIFQELWVNGISQGHKEGIRVPDYDGPITDVASNDIICNGGINPFAEPVSTTIIPVPAGSEVTAEFHHTLASAEPNNPSDPVDPSHKGPIIAYLAKVPSALQTDVTGLDWFKIYEDGLGSDGLWAVDKLMTNKGKVSFKIPDCIAAGEYLLRVELIALHGAGSYPGAQFYMECAQLKITGDGNTSPPSVSFPGAYKGSDLGVTVNIFSDIKSYIIPGPEVFTCSGSNPVLTSASSPITTITTTSLISSTTTATTSLSTFKTVRTSTTSSAPTTTSSAVSATVARWGQCGGIGFTGPTVCVAPYTCIKSNDYYSQCL